MHVDDQVLLSVADAFNGAAFTGDWLGALAALSKATGSRIGQLVGIGSANSVPFNWVTELGPDYIDDFRALDGGNPEVNPFVRAGSQVAPLKVLSSADFLTRQERKRNAFIAEHSVRHDIHHVCLTPLIKERDNVVGLAVIRSASQGEITTQQRAVFAAIAPHARSAVRTQIALEHKGAELMAGTLEALSLTAYICDRQGKVSAMTPSAELVLSEGNLLKLKNGSLQGSNSLETRALSDAIMQATGGLTKFGTPVSSTILVRDQLAQPVVVQVLALPRRDFTFSFEPRAIVIVRRSQQDVGTAKLLLSTAYELTSAEADVAMRLVAGQSPEQIAAARNASVGTVRAQIRSIYDKFGVNRFSEFAARVNQLR